MTWLNNVEESHRNESEVPWNVLKGKRQPTENWRTFCDKPKFEPGISRIRVRNTTIFLTCSTKRFSKSVRRPRSHNVWEILCPFLFDFIKAEALVDVGLLKGMWRKLKCMTLEYRKYTKSNKNYKVWEVMENVIHIYVKQNKRI